MKNVIDPRLCHMADNPAFFGGKSIEFHGRGVTIRVQSCNWPAGCFDYHTHIIVAQGDKMIDIAQIDGTGPEAALKAQTIVDALFACLVPGNVDVDATLAQHQDYAAAAEQLIAGTYGGAGGTASVRLDTDG